MITKAMQPLLVALVLFSNLSGVYAADADTIQRARQEKNLIVYGAPEPNFMRPLVDKFIASYPFINTTYLRGGSERLVPKIQTEARAGKVMADVYCLRMAAMMLLRNEDLLTRYDSSERKSINDIHRDKEGYWTGLYTGMQWLGYNTKLVSSSEVQRRHCRRRT